MVFKIEKRTFKAKLFPKGSTKRKEFNRSAITSEYVPSEKFIIFKNGNRFGSGFRTKKEANLAILEYKPSKFLSATERGIKRKKRGLF